MTGVDSWWPAQIWSCVLLTWMRPNVDLMTLTSAGFSQANTYVKGSLVHPSWCRLLGLRSPLLTPGGEQTLPSIFYLALKNIPAPLGGLILQMSYSDITNRLLAMGVLFFLTHWISHGKGKSWLNEGGGEQPGILMPMISCGSCIIGLACMSSNDSAINTCLNAARAMEP